MTTFTLRAHWREYLSEALCLGIFMLSAATAATVLQHPMSPWSLHAFTPLLARIPMGMAMGSTAMAIVYSPVGRRSGAHMNPAITLTFLRLGKIAAADAAGYIAAQFSGGLAGILLASALLDPLAADPSVNYVATVPGPAGATAAFVGELAISFGLMLMILIVSNHVRWSRLTGVFAGVLVCAYITVEAPLSGMSMNAARSLGPALLAGSIDSLWIYFVAPLAGMLAAAEVFVRRVGSGRVLCAKLHHPTNGPCIFRCQLGGARGASA